MLKCNAEFDNKIASSLSPLDFLNKKVFGDNVIFKSWDEKKKIATYGVYIFRPDPIEIMEIRLKNLEQV